MLESVKKLRFHVPFPCVEVFDMLGALVDQIPQLEELNTRFVLGLLWKRWYSSTDQNQLMSTRFCFEHVDQQESAELLFGTFR